MKAVSSYTIAIASGKGGTGKTMLATNLAMFLSRYSQTLLVDLDVEEPNDALFIRGIPGETWDQQKMIPSWDDQACIHCGECAANCSYHAVIFTGSLVLVFDKLCHSCYACSELCPSDALPMKPQKMGEIREYSRGGLTLVESRLQVGEEQAVPLIHRTQELIRQRFATCRWHILDSPPGTSCPVVAATRHADLVILVAEPTPFGLHDLRLAAGTMQRMGKDFGVVVNRYDIGDEGVDTFCREEGIPVFGRIPFDHELAVSYSHGELAFERVPSLAEALAQIRSQLEQRMQKP